MQKSCAESMLRNRIVFRKFDRNEDFFGKIGHGVSNLREVIIFVPGKLPEWSNGADSKSVELLMWFLGFESLTFRHDECRLAKIAGLFLSAAVRAIVRRRNFGRDPGHAGRMAVLSRFDGPTLP